MYLSKCCGLFVAAFLFALLGEAVRDSDSVVGDRLGKAASNHARSKEVELQNGINGHLVRRSSGSKSDAALLTLHTGQRYEPTEATKGDGKAAGASGNAFKTFGMIACVFVVVLLAMQVMKKKSAAPTEQPAEQPRQEQHQDSPELRELKGKRMKAMMDQAMKKEQYEKLMREIIAMEAAQNGEPAISDEELNKKAKQAMDGAEIMTQRSMFSAVAYATPIVMESQRFYDEMQTNVSKAQERTKKLMADQSKQMFSETMKTLNLNLDTKATAHLMKDMKPPKLAILIASAAAPAQLKSRYYSNKSSILLNLVYILLNCLILFKDSDNDPCWNQPVVIGTGLGGFFQSMFANIQTNIVLGWTFIDLFVVVFFTMVRLLVNASLSELVEQLEAPPPVNIAEDAISAFKILLDYYMVSGGRALMELERISESLIFELAGYTGLFGFLWMLYGVSVVYNTPYSGCKLLALWALRVRVTLFLMAFLPVLIGIIFFIVEKVLASEKFAMILLRIADGIDEAAGLGLPIGKVLVYSLMCKSMEDMITVELKIQQVQTEKLQSEKAELEASLQKAQDAAAAAEEKVKKLEEERDALGAENPEAQFKKIKDEALANSEMFLKQVQNGAENLQRDAVEGVSSITTAAAAEMSNRQGEATAAMSSVRFEDLQDSLLDSAAGASSEFASASVAASSAAAPAHDAAEVEPASAAVKASGKAKARTSRSGAVTEQEVEAAPAETAPG